MTEPKFMSGDIQAQRNYFRDLYFADSTSYAAHAAASGQTALKSLFLANGGATLALLTLLGNTNATYEPTALFWSFVWFGSGLVCALFSQLAHFRMQATNAMESFHTALFIEQGIEAEEYSKRGGLRSGSVVWYRAMMASSTAATVMFLIGIFVALDAVT